MPSDDLPTFEANRGRLFGLAYRMLGEVFEAEDVLQDAYLRWRSTEGVERPDAWLTTVVIRLCISRLSRAQVRRAAYPSSWLPEPVDTGSNDLGPLETVEQRESVSLGMLVLMERLSPPERAVFVLREAFGYSHLEIGVILGVDEANSRQILRRGRRHLAAGGRRFIPDQQQRSLLVDRFFAAAVLGDLAELESLLAADVVTWTDGGGRTAARHPLVGKEKVARYLAGVSRHPDAAGVKVTVREINAAPAMVVTSAAGVTVLAAEMLEGQVVAIRILADQERVGHLVGL